MAVKVSAPADWLHALVFEATGLHEMAWRFAGAGRLSIPDSVVRSAWIRRHEMIETAMLGTQLIGLRAGILMRILPLAGLLYAVGASEGMLQRASRRAGSAKESASLYHRAKIGKVGILLLGIAGILVWPDPVARSLCAIVGGLAFTALSVLHSNDYKKHT